MYEVLARYILGLVVGTFLGLMFPTLVPTWLLWLTPLLIVVITEVIGTKDFTGHWYRYRKGVYFIHSAVALLVWFGILFGKSLSR